MQDSYTIWAVLHIMINCKLVYLKQTIVYNEGLAWFTTQ